MKRFTIIACTLLATLLSSQVLNSSIGGTYRTDLGVYQTPTMSRPPLRVPYTDPVFGSTVTRVTDPSMDNQPGGAGVRHEYSRLPAFNADNTKAILFQLNGGQYWVVDLATGNKIREIPLDGVLDPTAVWHRTDPDLLIYRYGNEIRTLKPSTGQTTVVMAFPQYAWITSRQEGIPSDDWRYFAFLGFKPGVNWSKADLVTVDLQTKTILRVLPDDTDWPDWIGMSPSGQYVLGAFTSTRGTVLYDRNLNMIRRLHDYVSHADFAIDADGTDVYVFYAWSGNQITFCNDTSSIVKIRLAENTHTCVIDTQWKWGSHLSGIVSRGRPGWILISSDEDQPPPPHNAPFQGEVAFIKLDGSGQVKRLAHTHATQWSGSSTTMCDGLGKDYWAESHATSSWDGTHVMFSSTWNAAPCTRYDTYMVTGNLWPGGDLRGDLDGDGDRDLDDLRRMIYMLVGTVPKDLTTADLDGDGQLLLIDLQLLVKILVGIP